MTEYHWRLPGVIRFLKDIAEELESGRNCIVFIPEKIDDNFLFPLKEILREASACQLFNCRLQGKTALESLYEWFSLDLSVSPRIEDLIHQVSESKYFFLNQSSIDESDLRVWFKFISDYSASCMQKEIHKRIKFCFFVNRVNEIDLLPGSGPALSHILFNNYLNEIDLVTLISPYEGEMEPLDFEMLRVLTDELVFPNLELLNDLLLNLNEFLNDSVGFVDRNVRTELQSCNEAQESRDVLTLEKSFYDKLTHKHPLFRDWLCGLIEIRRKVMRPSTLALVKSGRLDILEKRMWQAHLKVFFPIIEVRRIYLVEWLKKNNNKLNRNVLDDLIEENGSIEDLEIGKIEYLMKKSKIDDRAILHMTSVCKDLRNSLAHLQPLTTSDLERLMKILNIRSSFIGS